MYAASMAAASLSTNMTSVSYLITSRDVGFSCCCICSLQELCRGSGGTSSVSLNHKLYGCVRSVSHSGCFTPANERRCLLNTGLRGPGIK